MMIIYKITNEMNGKSYIGKTTKTFNVRWTKHKSDAKHQRDNHHFHNAIRKYGINCWKFEILDHLHESFPIELLNKKEQERIFEFDTFKNGYNSSLGGESNLGHKHTEESKILISQNRKGKGSQIISEAHKEILRKRMTNRKISQETREKMRAVNLGKKLSEETRAKMSLAQKQRQAAKLKS